MQLFLHDFFHLRKIDGASLKLLRPLLPGLLPYAARRAFGLLAVTPLLLLLSLFQFSLVVVLLFLLLLLVVVLLLLLLLSSLFLVTFLLVWWIRMWCFLWWPP